MCIIALIEILPGAEDVRRSYSRGRPDASWIYQRAAYQAEPSTRGILRSYSLRPWTFRAATLVREASYFPTNYHHDIEAGSCLYKSVFKRPIWLQWQYLWTNTLTQAVLIIEDGSEWVVAPQASEKKGFRKGLLFIRCWEDVCLCCLLRYVRYVTSAARVGCI